MYRCAHCGGNHRKPETAQKCAREALLGPRGRTLRAGGPGAVTSFAKDQNVPQPSSEDADGKYVPNGHYFLPAREWPPDGLHAWVRMFKTGRWAGVWFVTTFERGATPEMVRQIYDRQYIVEKINKLDPMYCMVQYGRLFNRCGVCDEELTVEEAQDTAGHVECFEEAFETEKV